MMAPVLVRIDRRRCVLLGVLQAAMAVFVLSLAAVPLAIGIFDWLVFAGLLVAGFFCWFALYFLGLSRKNPVILRLDEQGISRFYADPATWDEIKSVYAFADGRAHQYLGFALVDPVRFRARQSPWRRLRAWSNGRRNGAHIVVPQALMAGTTAEALAATATQFLARHRDKSVPPPSA